MGALRIGDVGAYGRKGLGNVGNETCRGGRLGLARGCRRARSGRVRVALQAVDVSELPQCAVAMVGRFPLDHCKPYRGSQYPSVESGWGRHRTGGAHLGGDV